MRLTTPGDLLWRVSAPRQCRRRSGGPWRHLRAARRVLGRVPVADQNLKGFAGDPGRRLTIGDIGAAEINEAFASVVVPRLKQTGADPARIDRNVTMCCGDGLATGTIIELSKCTDRRVETRRRHLPPGPSRDRESHDRH
jgi:hypothetical protein